MPESFTASAQAGPILVTVAYLALYYATQLWIARTKRRLHRTYRERGDRFDRYFGQDREMLAADRVQLNLLEHMPPFIALLWLNAVFVSPTSATIGGACYLATRLLHPFMVGSRLGRDIPITILLVTAPGYLVLVYFMAALAWAVAAT